jgi:nucleoid DNA-binding protein
MGKQRWLALAVLLGASGLILARTAPAQSERPPVERPPGGETFPQRVAQAAQLSEENAVKFLNALGPAVRDELKRGKQVGIPGLGVLRVVNIPEHRDLVNGRPVVVPAENYVEFVPSAELVDAANSAGAVPADVVPPFQYIPLPGQTPGQKMGRTRVPPIRSK